MASVFAFALGIGLFLGDSVTTAMSASASASLISSGFQKHPLEDIASWELHLERQRSASGPAQPMEDYSSGPTRNLLETNSEKLFGGKEDNDDDDVNGDKDNDDSWELPFTVEHKKPKKHVPFAGGDTTHGIMIDAGSQGTRLHIYEWDKRFLLDEDDLVEQSEGKLLSYPTSNNRWTDKYTPGLDMFAQFEDNPEILEQTVGNYLGSLLDFARGVLRDKEDEWHTYPIYLKATGGLRTLPQPQRVVLMNCVRKLFHNKTYCPFDFVDERARVISGEEEAIYGWVGVNFAKGVLIDQTLGTGVGLDPSLTYGMLEMGGASTQIANWENNGDVMANLFKLQLGGSRHWNVYVHSYLYFGINGAWHRLNARLYWEGRNDNPCLPLGSTVEFDSWMHMNEKAQFYPRSHPKSKPYAVTMVNNEKTFDYKDCSKHVNDLLRKRTNQDWCDFENDSNCGFAGIYQPPMPQVVSPEDRFIATSNFVDVFDFLALKEKTKIGKINEAAEYACSLTWEQLKVFNSGHKKPIKTDLELAQMCFRSVFVYQLLSNGWEFGDDYKLEAVDVINGQKMGWALGCMLYEINTLPWKFHPELLYRGPSRLVLIIYVILGTLGGSAVGFILAMRFNKSFNKKIRESVFFKEHPEFVQNRSIRKSLALPDYMPELDDEIEKLYGSDESQGNSPTSERTSLILAKESL